jgi:oligopeptide/dipeptide ABC transporter ATP-binding protein
VGFAFLGYAVEEWADPRLAGTTARRPSRRRTSRPAGPPDPPPAPGTVLEVRHLDVEYRTAGASVRAVEGANLVVRPGRIVGLVGESGSGKSSLAMAVLGLLRPPARLAGGAVVFGGRDLRGLGAALMARLRGRDIALVPQSAMNALNPAYTIHRQVAEAAALTRDERAAGVWADELLERVGIPAERRRAFPHELSGGMRQRVVIAMAIANRPSLLVADEPVTGLDVVTQARILRLLLDLQAELELAIVLISHDLPLVARVADDLLVMYAGRIVEEGTTEVVTTEPAHPYTRQLLRAFPSVRGPRQRLASIEGDPGDTADANAGCPFGPRCPEAVEACRRAEPPVTTFGPGHQAACIHPWDP